MKKAIGIGLLLLANIVLLVHAVIPHHHHDQLFNFCDITFHQHDAINHCRHLQSTGTFSENDKHTHRGLGLDDCVLDDVYVRFVNDDHRIYVDESHIDFPSSLLCSLPYNPIQIKAAFTPLPFRQKPHLESFYTNHITQSTGLRAPPYC